MKQILVVEDDTSIREMLSLILENSGFEVKEAEDYEQAMLYLQSCHPDLLLLDWMLPKGSGIQLLKYIKQQTALKKIPVIMLSARSSEEDRVIGLDVGADDYIVKPFSPKELIARINAVLRRGQVDEDETLSANGLVVNLTSHRATANNNEIELSPIEFKLLAFLMKNPERVYSREQLLDYVWGTNVYVEDRTVDVVIRRLRKVLEKEGFDKMVQTVRSAGYRFSLH